MTDEELAAADRRIGHAWSGDPPEASIWALARRLLAEIRRLQTERAAIDKEEVAHSQTIDERDAAEEALSQVVCLVTGRLPPWSNIYGHAEAIEDVGDCVSVLKQAARATAEDDPPIDAAPPSGASLDKLILAYGEAAYAAGASPSDQAKGAAALAALVDLEAAIDAAPPPGGQTVEQAIEALEAAAGAHGYAEECCSPQTAASTKRTMEAYRAALLRAIAAREAEVARAAESAKHTHSSDSFDRDKWVNRAVAAEGVSSTRGFGPMLMELISTIDGLSEINAGLVRDHNGLLTECSRLERRGAEVARAAAANRAEEFGWVIERGDSPPHGPTYWSGPEYWSQDHLDAVRFARKQDAERVAYRLGQGYHRVCEHGWISRAPAPAGEG